jgi:hypothetical protein
MNAKTRGGGGGASPTGIAACRKAWKRLHSAFFKNVSEEARRLEK